MRILFTGSSSFTGYWFVQELVNAGHDVVATFQKTADGYTGMRGHRVEQIKTLCHTVFDCPLGNESFLALIRQCPRWDLWCQHAAQVNNYKSPDFDPIKALANNCENLPATLRLLKDKGCRRVLLTGSVFEGTDFSPYGLSKGMTADVFSYYARVFGFHLGKFVIPNPFGPFEEDRLTTSLARLWLQGKTGKIATPDYVRDNIHVSLLAKAYAAFTLCLPDVPGYAIHRPSGYVEAQGAFVQRFASEMEKRLGLPCRFVCSVQQDFPEPRIRINCDKLDEHKLTWSEEKSWDELAAFYGSHYSQNGEREKKLV